MSILLQNHANQKASEKIAPKAGFLDKCEQAVSAHSIIMQRRKFALTMYRRNDMLILNKQLSF